MRIAIIPARAGSKRIKNKNIIDFCGKPMLYYPICAALESELYEVVHVSTDSDEIASVARNLGASVEFMRSEQLADDDTPVLDVARFVLKKFKEDYQQEFSSFTMIMPCSPLLFADDLRCAQNIYDRHLGKYPVLSVAPFPSPPEWAFEEISKDLIKVVDERKIKQSSNGFTKKFYDTGTFSIQSCAEVMLSGYKVKDKFLSYELPFWRAIDIDEPQDLENARRIFSAGINNDEV